MAKAQPNANMARSVNKMISLVFALKYHVALVFVNVLFEIHPNIFIEGDQDILQSIFDHLIG